MNRILTESSQFCRLYVFVVLDSDIFENAVDEPKRNDKLKHYYCIEVRTIEH